jgi:hypothetical protein
VSGAVGGTIEAISEEKRKHAVRAQFNICKQFGGFIA